MWYIFINKLIKKSILFSQTYKNIKSKLIESLLAEFTQKNIKLQEI